MNTGTAYMTEVVVQRLNSSGEFLYEETLSILDAFGTYPKISPFALSLHSVQAAQARYEAFMQWLEQSYLQTDKPIVEENSFIEENSKSCPLPQNNWEVKESVFAETTLKKLSVEGTATLSTTFDTIETDTEPYRIEFKLISGEVLNDELDLLGASEGELLYKSQRERSRLVFDINHKGELIVIGEDAQNYFLNELGELCYKYN